MNVAEFWNEEWGKRIVNKTHVLFNQGKAKFILETLDMKNFYKPLQILDIGCGPAIHANNIIRYEPEFKDRWYGIDVSEKAIEFVKSKGFQCEVANIYDFNPDRKFDVFFLLDSLEHISNRKKAAEKIKELSNGNTIIFGNIPLYIDNHGLESGYEEPMDFVKLNRFVLDAGCVYLNHFIYGVHGCPYMVWEAYK
jgi:2-polyprenyl-3-methyl-5-hydroxy-6-metoxy-1,4-benzoquinol methylase